MLGLLRELKDIDLRWDTEVLRTRAEREVAPASGVLVDRRTAVEGVLRRLANTEPTLGGEELLTDENHDAEEVYLGLRTRRGLEIGEADLAVAEMWRTAGWAQIEHVTASAPLGTSSDRSGPTARLRLTPSGWLQNRQSSKCAHNACGARRKFI